MPVRLRRAGGVTTTRCTGDTCDESDVSVMTHSYAAASEASVAWMANPPSCTRTVEGGNWVASEQNARIDTPPILCINGSLTVDVATRVTIPPAPRCTSAATSTWRPRSTHRR